MLKPLSLNDEILLNEFPSMLSVPELSADYFAANSFSEFFSKQGKLMKFSLDNLYNCKSLEQ